MFLKRCSKCGQWKAKLEFGKDKSKKDGLCSCCKKCKAIYTHKHYWENKENLNKKAKQWRKKHKKEIAEYNREYQKTHKKQMAEYWNEYQKTHKEVERRKNSKYRGLGYNPLNEPFKGSVMHHIDDVNVIFIPDKIHRRFNGRGHTLEYHRKGILKYYGSIKRMIKNKPL